MFKKLIEKIRHARFVKNRALSVNTNHKNTVDTMPAELQFVIPGIYISRSSAESPNSETAKEMLRVFEESDRENFFKTDAGREMSESEILSNYLLYSAFESEKKTSDNERKAKRLMRNFVEVPLEEAQKNTGEKPVPTVPKAENDQRIILTPEQMSSGKMVSSEEPKTVQTNPGPRITEFERSMLDQFVRVGEKVTVERIELPINYDFEKVRTATKLLGLDKTHISKYIAFFIMQQPYLYETLSRKIEEMLMEEPQHESIPVPTEKTIEVQPEIDHKKELEKDDDGLIEIVHNNKIPVKEQETVETPQHEIVEEEARNLSKLIENYFSGK